MDKQTRAILEKPEFRERFISALFHRGCSVNCKYREFKGLAGKKHSGIEVTPTERQVIRQHILSGTPRQLTERRTYLLKRSS